VNAQPGEAWQIELYAGVGPVRLGMTRQQIEAALGSESVPVDKGDARPVAVFDEVGVHAHFDARGGCEAVELMNMAQPVLDGMPLLARPYEEVTAWLAERDPELQVNPPDVTSYQLGIGLYAPAAVAHPQRPAEGVIVFARGYYDS
jgi:hypothetical protein